MLTEEGLDNVFCRHLRFAEATRRAVQAWGLDMVPRDAARCSSALTAVFVPEGFNEAALRAIILDKFDMSLGAGLGKLAGRVFRIGHLGDLIAHPRRYAVRRGDGPGTGRYSPSQRRRRRSDGLPVPRAETMNLVSINTVSPETLRRELEPQIEGELRFDTITRALYSTDASVYQIQPIGVVVPKNRQDILRTLEVCRRHRCPITMRGGGTSQAGQAIGQGLQIDVSKYCNRVLEVNAAGLWARVEPGVVLDELNAQLAPLGVRFAPDISAGHRATVGGMMADNSSGARSVIYGKTIDHVLKMTVALTDGSVAEFREISRHDVPTGDTLEAACYRTVLGLASTHAGEIDTRYPKILRRVGGYNLDEFVDPSKPVNLARMIVGSEGDAGDHSTSKLRLVPLPKAKAVMVIAFAALLESLAAAL